MWFYIISIIAIIILIFFIWKKSETGADSKSTWTEIKRALQDHYVGKPTVVNPQEQSIENSNMLTGFIEDGRKFDSKGEELTIRALENIFCKVFYKVNPTKKSCMGIRLEWLKNPRTGRYLELDGYNHDLRLAVEYQGQQHYIYPNIYHKTFDEYKKQKERDDFKRRSCDANGVYLITVPYTVKYDDIEKYILGEIPDDLKSKARS